MAMQCQPVKTEDPQSASEPPDGYSKAVGSLCAYFDTVT